VMDLEWFAPEAYAWTLASALFVWSCAIVMVLLQWHGAAFGWNWLNNPVVLMVAASVSIAFAVYADFSAMKWCVVPWLQKVRKLEVVRCKLPFRCFLTFQLLSTLLQVLTIQTNAWFMVTAAQESGDVVGYWHSLWKKSMFGFVPESIWNTWITPKSVAILLWCLSTVQLILPLMTSVPWPGSKTNYSFPTRNAEDSQVTSAELFIKYGWGKQEERGFFVPESFHNNFSTVWNKLVVEVLEVWGFHSYLCTYRESVANLALAAGLRYTGSMSISYPRQSINQIMQFQEGYTFKTKDGLDPMPMGWELRALTEFQQLARTHCKRVFFIMFCKLALQLNLQITFLSILRIQQKALDIEYMNQTNVILMISIASLFLTFFTEFIDVAVITVVFMCLCYYVRGTALKVGGSAKAFAQQDFEVEESGDKSVQSIIHSGSDLKAEYYVAWRLWFRMITITFISMWLIGYALLKAFCAVSCQSGVWNYSSGCLPPMGQNQST